ncbi:hypothetical protein J1N35_028664 [Gossypium stocksii]|uniref:Putative plant transposon protein domain-containing protein n=1 Tax=Gossypium stocksii TaxID=47602 RepID=A0A9D3UWF6_9ROSI|nr:hypothetical protein J1N35_028664 [Gossypium stocksii]
MPCKRTRASAQIDETQNKFHYEEAKVRYESIFKNQQMHPKKGFTSKESNYRDFMARIRQVAEALNWELFCEKRPSVDEELVREFYANLTSSELTEVLVCGIKVPINSNAINEFFEVPDFENDEYSSLLSNIKPENLHEILEKLTIPGSKWTVSKQRIHTCRREYLTPLVKVWFYFIRFILMPSSNGTTISLERMVLLYSILTRKTIDVGKIILTEIQNYVVRRSGLAYFPFTITILCLKAKILANIKKTGVEESEDPEEAKDNPTEIEPEQSAEVPNEAELMEPEAELDVETSMFGALPLSPNLRNELSKLMDLMQHMQWQQQAYWRY